MKKVLIIILSFISVINIISINAANNIINADSYILIEKDSKRILDGKNIDKQLLTASICKIMTCIVAIENGELDKEYMVTEEVTKQIGSSIYLTVGEKIKLIDLLYGMMLRSGNDAAYMIAISVSENVDKFVDMMNDLAKKIGMRHSVFSNPSGLDDETYNYSTAYDMAILMAYCLNNETFCDIVSSKNYSFKTVNGNYRSFSNKHKLVNAYDYITGGKTGYTKLAKRTLVTSASKNGMTLIAVTFNCSDDWNAHLSLFDYGYENFQIKEMIKSGIVKVDEYLYDYTPYIPISLNYPVRENEKYNIIIYLLNNPKDKIIGKACLCEGEKIVAKTDVYRYY